MKNERNSQIELIRILGMVLIVFHHLAIHGYRVFNLNYIIAPDALTSEINNVILLKSFLWPGKLGVGLFVMITGWFATQKDGQPDWKKIINIWLTYFFYNAVLCIILLFNGKLESPLLFLPVFYRTNWYINGYLILLIVMPVLLSGLDKLSRKNHFLLCIIFLIIDMLPWRWEDASYWASSTYTPLDSIEMFILVVICQYIKKYRPKFFEKKKLCVGICFCLILFITAYYFIVFKTGLKNNVSQETLNRIVDYSSCLFPLMSITLFMGLKDIKIGVVKPINLISSLTLGVYLFHDNNNFYIPMWSFIMKYLPPIGDSIWKILLSGLVLCVLFFIIAGIFEMVRRPLFNLIFRKTDKSNVG